MSINTTSKASQQQPQKQLRLNPDAVRLRASSIAGCRALANTGFDSGGGANDSSNNQHDHVCVFLVGCSGPKTKSSLAAAAAPLDDPDGLARVTVYCDTGTIATARVFHGQVRHVFRRAVTSLDVVERCLRQPPALPPIDWKLLGLVDGECGTERPVSHIGKNLELLTVGQAILWGEREKLAQHLAALQAEGPSLMKQSSASTSTPMSTSISLQKQPQQQDEEQVLPDNKHSDSQKSNNVPNENRDNNINITTGMEFQFSLAAGPMKHVDQCLSDIGQMNKWVRGVATNGIGTVFLYGNGGVAYTPNIPRALYHRLSQLRHSKDHANRPCYVSLGSRERYFVAFHDGSFSYKGPKGMDKELRRLAKTPASVAFGSSYDTFCIVLADGTHKWGGKHMPVELLHKLGQQQQQQQPQHVPNLLSCVTLGPEGEWFLRMRDGQVAWGGVSDELEDAIRELLDADHVLNFLDFGENGSYFISYD